MPNNQLINESSQEKNEENKKAGKNKLSIEIGTTISGIALLIWFIPGLYLLFNIFKPVHHINPNLPDDTLEQIETIVDKKLNRNTDLINILLFVLTALPIVGNFYFWLLYKSVRSGMIENAEEGLTKKIEDQVEKNLIPALDTILKAEQRSFTIIENVFKSESLDDTIKTKLENILYSESLDGTIKIKLENILYSESLNETFKVKLLNILNLDYLDETITNKLLNLLNLEVLNEAIKHQLLNILNSESLNGAIKSKLLNILQFDSETNEMLNQNMNELIRKEVENLKNKIDNLPNKQELAQYQTMIISKIEEISKLQDVIRAKDYQDEGDKLFAQGNYIDAIIQYQWASLLDKENTFIWYKLAEAHRQLKEYRSAIRHYNKVIELDKENKFHNAHYYKAACHALEKQENEAIEYLKNAIKLNPDDFKNKAKENSAFQSIQSHYYKACFYALTDDNEAALKSLEEALKQNPELREKAETESAFNHIRNYDAFKSLISK